MADHDAFGESLKSLITAIQHTRRMTHAGVVLRCAAILEYDLERCICTRLTRDSESIRERLFEYPGPLSTFSAKIDLCFALGITDERLHQSLSLVRRMRNKFAHTKSEMHLASEDVVGLFKAMRASTSDEGASDLQSFANAVELLDNELERYLADRGVREDIRPANLSPEKVPVSAPVTDAAELAKGGMATATDTAG